MELNEQIYVNVEELRGTCSTYSRGPEKSETNPLNTGASAGKKRESCSSLKVAAVCLGLLCFLLLAAVAGVSVLYARDVRQLSRELANSTAEAQQLWARFQNLTDERDKLQSRFNKAGSCPSGWERFGCSCYFLSPEKGTWTNSNKVCSFQGAELVVIDSREEMVFLNQRGVYLKFWIGLSYSNAQKKWLWTDGGSLSTSYWQLGDPSKSQTCAAFNRFQTRTPKSTIRSWTSEACSQKLQWVCEKQLMC